VGGLLDRCVETLLRLVPRATKTGLRALGHPDREAPVLLTGNYTLTVRRVTAALRGRDAWLLVANSHGINVWCAAGGGHLTHHEVIAALRTSGIEERVERRELVLPQLAATGVERRRIEEATGWKVRWGPAQLEDLPAFLDHGRRVTRPQRRVRFPLRERCEMAATWFFPMAAAAALIVGLALSWPLALVAVGGLLALTFGTFAAVPWLDLAGRRSFAVCAASGLVAFALTAPVLPLLGLATPAAWWCLALTCALGAAILAIDLPGSTPWYPSTVNAFGASFDVDLDADRCEGLAECVQVCPREVLRMDGKRHLVVIAQPAACIRCGACIVQCPTDALRFRYPDGRVIPAAVVKRTRMNLVGRRTVRIPG
jgi:NAD-dependent dihydropyrimidine dehydrogenase PreA subunit